MKTTQRCLLTALILLTSSPLAAQYWGERVMEKGFEQTDFFFTPTYLMPYGIGSFKATTPGLLKDPLLDLIVNPARLADDSLHDQYLYTDFRGVRQIKDNDNGIYPQWGVLDSRIAADVMYFPIWNFTAERFSFQVPVFITVKASDLVEVLLGLNRTMTQWEINDVTLALFRYRIWQHRSELVEERNFGERYESPEERVTDVRTTFLAGLTVAPSEKVHLRLLMVPNFRDTFEGSELEQLQWWVGFTLTP